MRHDAVERITQRLRHLEQGPVVGRMPARWPSLSISISAGMRTPPSRSLVQSMRGLDAVDDRAHLRAAPRAAQAAAPWMRPGPPRRECREAVVEVVLRLRTVETVIAPAGTSSAHWVTSTLFAVFRVRAQDDAPDCRRSRMRWQFASILSASSSNAGVDIISRASSGQLKTCCDLQAEL